MATERLSIREIEILEAVARCSAVGMNTLANYFENRMSGDEVERVVDSLKRRRLVDVAPGGRTFVVSLTPAGRRTVTEVRQ